MPGDQASPAFGGTNNIDSNIGMPVELTRDFVLEKCEYFSDVGIWPLKSVMNPELWLTNFEDAELNHALYLLNSFMYFSNILVDEIFASSLRTVSRSMLDSDDTAETIGHKWKSFVEGAIVTYLTGETPNPTDSGYAFARKARKLGVHESRIVHPEAACALLTRGSDAPFIFVDDFIGSGNQFFHTWDRPYGVPSRCFRELAPIVHNDIYVCPAFCTEHALNRIRSECPTVRVNPGHILPGSYSALADDSVIWPSQLKSTAVDFIKNASIRAGIPDTDGTTSDDWRGFAKLGLAVALEGSVPDATLPLFYWERNGWHPLLRRGLTW